MGKKTYIKWKNNRTKFKKDIDITNHDTYYIYGRNGTGKTTSAKYNEEINESITSLSTKSIYFNVSSGNDTKETRKQFGDIFTSKKSKILLEILESWKLINKIDKKTTIDDIVGDDTIVKTIKKNIKNAKLQEYIINTKTKNITASIDLGLLTKMFKNKYGTTNKIITNETMDFVVGEYFKKSDFANIIPPNINEIKEEFLKTAKNQEKLELINLWIEKYNDLTKKVTELNEFIKKYNFELQNNEFLKSVHKNIDKKKLELISYISKKYCKHTNWHKDLCIYCENKISADRINEIQKINKLKIYNYINNIETNLNDAQNLLKNLSYDNDTQAQAKKIIWNSFKKEYDSLSSMISLLDKIDKKIKLMNKTNEITKIDLLPIAKLLTDSDLDIIINSTLTLSDSRIKEIIRNKILEKIKPEITKEKRNELELLAIEIKGPIVQNINKDLKILKIKRNLEIKLMPPSGLSSSQRAQIIDEEGNSIKYLSDGEKSTLAFVLFIEIAKHKIAEAYKENKQHIFILDDPIISNDLFVIAQKIKMIREITMRSHPEGDKTRPPGIVKVIILTHNSDLIIYNQEWLSQKKQKGMIYRVTDTEVKLIDFNSQLIDDLQLYQKVTEMVYDKPNKRRLKMFISLIWRIHDHLSEIKKLIPTALPENLSILRSKDIKKALFTHKKEKGKKDQTHLFNVNIYNNEESQNFIIEMIKQCAINIFNIQENKNFSLKKEDFDNLLEEPIISEEPIINENNIEMIEWICDSTFRGTFFNSFTTEETGIQQFLRHKKHLTAKDLSIIEMESNSK